MRIKSLPKGLQSLVWDKLTRHFNDIGDTTPNKSASTIMQGDIRVLDTLFNDPTFSNYLITKLNK